MFPFPIDEGEGTDFFDIEELLEQLAGTLLGDSPDFQAKVRQWVDAGARDCNCGRPTCLVGKAIRAEYARRNANGAGSQLTQAQITQAVYDGQMRAQHDFAKEQHQRAFTTRTWRFLLNVVGAAALLIVRILVTLLSAPFIFVTSTIFWPAVAIVALRRVQVMEIVRESTMTGEDPIKVAIKRLPWAYRAGFRTGKTIYGAVVSLSARIREVWHNRNWHPISWARDGVTTLIASLRIRFTRPAAAAQPADVDAATD